jgi:hypothetical protein
LHAIHCFGEKWLQNNSSLKKGLTVAMAKVWAVEALGRLIAEVKSGEHAYKGTDDCIPILKKFLTEWSQKRLRTFVHYFPCFVAKNDQTWAIGPVTILPRADWLNAVLSVSGDKSKTWIDTIREQWNVGSRDVPIACEALAPRERITARIALEYGPSPSVAKVVVEGSELSRAKERARVAASLAVDAIGLVLNSFSARKIIRGPDDELSPRLNYIFSQEQGCELTWSTELDLPTGGALAEHVLANYTMRVGQILEVLTKDASARATPELDNRWLNALYWFGKARREPADFLSISLMGAALDILTKLKFFQRASEIRR